VPFDAVKFDGLYVNAPPGKTTTLMLFELLADDDGGAAEEELDDGGGLPYWALTKIGRNRAVNARENFMVVVVVGKGVTEQTFRLPRNCVEKGMVRHGSQFLSF